MRRRVLMLSSLFLLVTLLSAPWSQSDDQGVGHFNAAPAKGERHGTQQPAQLLLRHSWCTVRNLSEGALLQLHDAQAGQDRAADPGGNYQRRLEAGRSADSRQHQLIVFFYFS